MEVYIVPTEFAIGVMLDKSFIANNLIFFK